VSVRKHFQPTVRLRLTLLYGGLFLAVGAVLLVVNYLLVRRSLTVDPRVLQERIEIRLGHSLFTFPAPPLSAYRRLETLLREAAEGLRSDALHALVVQSVAAFAALAVLCFGLGWLIAGRALRPLKQITGAARRLSGETLHERIDLQGPEDELKELADTFDAMLERLDQAFAGQRRFVANASHELRTPLAVSRTVLEVAMGDPAASGDLRQVGRTLLVTNERSERLIDGLLALASSDNEPLRVPVDLADVAAQTLEQVAAEAAERGVTVRSALAAAPVTGDGVLLERLALNLLQNGIRHNADGGWVEVVTAAAPGAWSEIVVANSGPVVPPYEVEALFEPFRRLQAERTASDRGVGLGLSIVRAVARAHGGVVTAAPRDGGGLVVRVGLPVAVPPIGSAADPAAGPVVSRATAPG